jgi:membrane protease subunit (stomatin/prohibitin family)
MSDIIFETYIIKVLSIRRNKYQIRCINEIYIGNFINGTIKELNLGTRLHNLTADGIRITMTKNQETWIVFKEIAVFVKR